MDKFTIELLNENDYYNGFLQLLEQLTIRNSADVELAIYSSLKKLL